MRHLLKFLFVSVIVLSFIAPALAASNWDGTYKVTGWTQTCGSLVDYKDQEFGVIDGAVHNGFAGQDAPIAADGTATLVHSDPPGQMILYLTFTNNGSTNTATGTWTSQSQAGDCQGTITAEATNFDFTGIIGIVGVCVVIGVGFVGIIAIGFIFAIGRPRLRPVHLPAPEAPIMNGAQPPAPAPVAPAPTPVVPAPAATPANKDASGPKRPVYGKKTVPKKGVRIWPELPRRKP
jgi:hypothetical protein